MLISVDFTLCNKVKLSSSLERKILIPYLASIPEGNAWKGTNTKYKAPQQNVPLSKCLFSHVGEHFLQYSVSVKEGKLRK